jgi:hypothetical protein
VQHHREIARRYDPPDLLDARGDPGTAVTGTIDLPPLVDRGDRRLRRLQRGDRRQHCIELALPDPLQLREQSSRGQLGPGSVEADRD